MDIWKYYDITYRHHLICNPLLPEKFERMCRLLSPRGKVLDMGCGKGETLIRLAELYNISGVGVDISPFCIEESLKKHRKRVPNSDIKFILMDGAKYRPESLFDTAICFGASFIYGGYAQSLEALRGMVVPGGLIVTGKAFWIKEPDPEYLKLASTRKEDNASEFSGNIVIGEEKGLHCIYAMESDLDDWDNYETLQWKAVHDYSIESPEDPDLSELIERKSKEKEYYLKWERGVLGWGVYIFRLPK